MMEPRSVSFVVFGCPQPKGSAKAFKHPHTGRIIVQADNRKPLKSWEASIRYAAQQQAGDAFFLDAVRIDLAFYFERPKSVSPKRRPFMTTRPDVDKCARGAVDALIGTLITDDALVVSLSASKQYARNGEGPHAEITITEVLPAAAEGRLSL